MIRTLILSWLVRRSTREHPCRADTTSETGARATVIVMTAPWMIRRRSGLVGAALVGAALLGVLAVLVAPGRPPRPPRRPPGFRFVAARPRELPLNGIDACSVITSPLRSQLGSPRG